MMANQAIATIASEVFCPFHLGRDLTAFVTEAGGRVSFDAAKNAADSVAASLRSMGLAPDDRVALLVPRGLHAAAVFLGISSVATCCPLNFKIRSDELKAAISSMSITAIVHFGEDALLREAGADHLPTLAISEFDAYFIPRQCQSNGRQTASVDAFPPQIALLMQTSGTTSAPKLVALSHANILAAGSAIRDAFGLSDADLCLNPMPLHHVHGLISATLSSLLSGSKVLCAQGFSPEAFGKLIKTHKPTWFTGSPTMHLALLDHFGGSREESTVFQGLRFFRSSSAPLPASTIERLEMLFQSPLVETYGLTETASMICSNPLPPQERKVGSVGIAFGSEIRIVDEQGTDKDVFEEGEIIIRGPSVISRYLRGGEDAFFGGWLRTGDVGYLDQDGYLYIVGRTKELIKRGGLSVYPGEIDNVLNAHEGVAEATCFSLPHPTLGEEVVAAVVLRKGSTVTAEQLQHFIGKQLSTYKVPTELILIDHIPKNETGKIVRRDLADHFASSFQPKRVPAHNVLEHALLDAWSSVLHRNDFGVTDNVFLLGGDPLRAQKVSEIIAATQDVKLPSRILVTEPTIMRQAAFAAGISQGLQNV